MIQERLHRPLMQRTGAAAFTLIELLVVIGIIAILAGLLLPAIDKAKLRAQGIQCLSNHRQLALAWRMYSDDNREFIPYASENPQDPSTYAAAWITGTLDNRSNNPSNWDPDVDIKKSPIWPYCGKNISIWRCPADRSSVLVNGQQLPRVRSMSMNVFLGGWGGTYGNWDLALGGVYSDYRIFMKQNEITLAGADRIFVFLDMREDSIDMGNFATSMRGWPDQPDQYEFFDLPGAYHHRACGFSFADGHSEIKRWQDLRTTPDLKRDAQIMDYYKSPNNPDIRWLQERTTRRK
jgi:prepilin-type N-terminal cleavage/methylation domain-containing protein